MTDKNYYNKVIQIIKNVDLSLEKMFILRIKQHKISRDENPTSHFCCFFAAIDIQNKQVFIGLHKKSGLWLFNGGHVDKDESPNKTIEREMIEEWGIQSINCNVLKPKLLTYTKIENKIQTCKEHFDIWFFVPVKKDEFNPDIKLLQLEFFEIKWVDIKKAKELCSGQYSFVALQFIENKYFKEIKK